MYKSYFKIGWRNLVRDKGYSFINIGGFALGIAVAMLIGLWVFDEVSYNKHHANYHDIAQVLQHNTTNGNIETYANQSYQLGAELCSNYGSYFKRVVMSYPAGSILSNQEKTFTLNGSFMEAKRRSCCHWRCCMVHARGWRIRLLYCYRLPVRMLFLAQTIRRERY